VEEARTKEAKTRAKRVQAHFTTIFLERLEVIETVFRIIPKGTAVAIAVKRDIRRFLAEAGIGLDLTDDPPRFQMLDEPLLQSGVIDELLPRIAKKYPDRARELVEAYHNVVAGTSLDSVFSEAFKTLEEIVRAETGNPSFTFDASSVAKSFPKLHATTQATLVKLAAHRGDKASHGREAPNHHEIRYLLFAICNIALLILDYPRD
jgi:hypothetical protein